MTARIDGRPASAEAAAALLAAAGGCYTTGRYVAGRVALGARVAARLVRDARALRLPAPDAEACLAELVALGREAFGRGEGVVRLAVFLDAAGRPRRVASVRPLGPEPALWSAIVAGVPHPGPGPAPGAKRGGVAVFAAARREAEVAGADEALLLDAAGRVVEGARSNLLVCDGSGRIVTPAVALGAVAGVALEAAREELPELVEGELSEPELRAARELVALNAVRGARPIASLVGGAPARRAPGPLAARLAALLAATA